MSKNINKELLPELRFPEFENLESWNNEPLEDIYEFKVTNSLSRDKLNYDAGTVKNIHYGDIHTKFSTLFDIEKEFVPYINTTEPLGKIKKDCYCIEGDMVFADASEDLDDVGKSIEVVNLNNEKLVAGLHTLLARQKEAKLVIGFGGYLFKSNRLREQIKKEAQGAKVLGISAGRMSKIEVAYPSNKKEQQKIADCLSSLDDLITAHTQKYQALQTYKKGLMQNLFPAEGEIVPALRFPEFEDAGDWEIRLFSESIRLYRGSSPRPIKEYLTKKENGVNWIKIGDTSSTTNFTIRSVSEKITPKGAEKSRKVKKGELILANSMSYGATYLLELDGCIYDGWFVLREYEDAFNREFLLQLLNSTYMQEQYKKLAAGGIVQNISSEIVYSTLLPKPSIKEQQRIASFLSSVDDLIMAQTHKLEELKAHKKGLMQQLFPAMDEVVE